MQHSAQNHFGISHELQTMGRGDTTNDHNLAATAAAGSAAGAAGAGAAAGNGAE